MLLVGIIGKALAFRDSLHLWHNEEVIELLSQPQELQTMPELNSKFSREILKVGDKGSKGSDAKSIIPYISSKAWRK